MFCIVATLAACGGDAALDQSCDEPRRYEAVSPGRKIVVPEGLDPLDELREMPVPRAEDAPQRPRGARCIELPPTIIGGSS